MIHSTILEVTSAMVFQQFFTIFAGFSHSNTENNCPRQDTDVVGCDKGIDWIVNQFEQEVAEDLANSIWWSNIGISTIQGNFNRYDETLLGTATSAAAKVPTK